MKLDEDFMKIVKQPIYAVWDYIGSDVMQCCDECGEPCDNESAVESCIDANRLTTQNFKEADDAVLAAIKEHGYPKVLKFLTKNISLN